MASQASLDSSHLLQGKCCVPGKLKLNSRMFHFGSVGLLHEPVKAVTEAARLKLKRSVVSVIPGLPEGQ